MPQSFKGYTITWLLEERFTEMCLISSGETQKMCLNATYCYKYLTPIVQKNAKWSR